MTGEQIIVGIDEAGRGPLAGPVYVGLIVAQTDFDFSQYADLADSKQMTESEREKVFQAITSTKDTPLDYTIRYTTADVIDKRGITIAIRQAINRGLRGLDLSLDKTKLLLDGRLSAPSKYTQETITKGDQKRSIISLASVLAKVARDRRMKRLAGEYPNFNFGRHKGYGTKGHREQIKQHGACDIHRDSFVNSGL